MEKSICICGREFDKQSSLSSHYRFCKLHVKEAKKIFTGECECGKIFEKAQSLNAHYSHCIIHRKGNKAQNRFNGREGWAKGLSKDTDIRIFNNSQSYFKNLKEGVTIPSFKGKSHTVESKRNLSEKRIEFLEENPNSNIKWYIISNGVRDIKVQGEWELNVAQWLNSLSIKWDRKRILFDDHRRYTPDFWLPEHNLYLEVKGFLRDSDIKKMKTVIEQTGIHIKLLSGKQYKNLELLGVDDIPNFE